MANKFYNKQVGQMPHGYGWDTKGINKYSGGSVGVGAYNQSGSPKDKRGSKGARNGADKSGHKGKTFSVNYK